MLYFIIILNDWRWFGENEIIEKDLGEKFERVNWIMVNFKMGCWEEKVIFIVVCFSREVIFMIF